MMKIMRRLKLRQEAFANHRPVVISFLGDSVTHGCFEVFINEHGKIDSFCRAEKAYPYLLANELGKLFPNARPSVINAGVAGDNAVNGRKRLERDVLFASPDLVIVNFGLNDSANPDVEGGLKAYDQAMRGIFESVLASGAECMLVTPNFMCKYVSYHLADEKLISIAKAVAKVQNEGILKKYVECAKKAAKDMNIPVADAYSVWESLEKTGADTTKMLSNDINHPTEEMHRIFVNEIMRVLLEG
ncbi:MAG: hypothetical protein IJC48_05500 [Clostridia bacterium]|nr:hypothetical protein [Clostridia bacterium]